MCPPQDELVSCHSLSFSTDGTELLCGYESCVRVFTTQRPGRHCTTRTLRCGGQAQKGLIGCLAVSPAQELLCCGSYGRSVGLYPMDGGGAVALWPQLPFAPTYLRFSPDGVYLYAGGRKANHILCWDVRHPDKELFVMERRVATNQRVTFDLDPLHPWLPIMATSSGQRVFPVPWDSDDEGGDDDDEPPRRGDNGLQLWWWGGGEDPCYGDKGDNGGGHMGTCGGNMGTYGDTGDTGGGNGQ
ncbi:telomerase Cajal body protein 1 [Coturnix japonica]|uniref:telomerase Cajal body protein 1 n=1 Tax=Coturnix japonica TaxID=93934 RepID=UPI0013A5D409|nr:telomerase Cajal body protein 1 [Coturnix japonica]